MSRKVPWTSEEIAVLTREWGDCRRRTLMGKLRGRTWGAICQRAYTLGLPPRDQGRVRLGALTRRFGCRHAQLRAVLEAAGVPVRRVESPSAGRYGPVRYPWESVDPELAEYAWRAWLDLESLHGASRVREVPISTLRTWALRSGVSTVQGHGRATRLPSEVIDRIVATRGREPMPRFDLAAYLRGEVERRTLAAEREAVRALLASRVERCDDSAEVRRAS